MSDKQTDVQRSIMTSSFRDRESAERPYNATAARGYKNDEIHVLMSDETRKGLFTTDGEKTDMGNKALQGAGGGGAVGATAGGLVGLLVGAGISEERAKVYETELKEGGIVLGVKPRHDEDARYFETEWANQHVRRWFDHTLEWTLPRRRPLLDFMCNT